MNALKHIITRELSSYFSTPLAYVFIVIFLTLIGSLTFYIGNFFVRGQADLYSFFAFHPWVYILLIPAVTMRLWAEERKTGRERKNKRTYILRNTVIRRRRYTMFWCGMARHRRYLFLFGEHRFYRFVFSNIQLIEPSSCHN